MFSNLPILALVTCTAYTNTIECCNKTDGITASGTIAKAGITVAADHLPLGTIVEINGHQYIVQDRFGAGHDNRIDIYMSTMEECWEFGVKEMAAKIFLPEEEKEEDYFTPDLQYYRSTPTLSWYNQYSF